MLVSNLYTIAATTQKPTRLLRTTRVTIKLAGPVAVRVGGAPPPVPGTGTPGTTVLVSIRGGPAGGGRRRVFGAH